jgi:hypothetical protein
MAAQVLQDQLAHLVQLEAQDQLAHLVQLEAQDQLAHRAWRYGKTLH